MPRSGLNRLLDSLLLSCLILAACSGLGESARYKQQADQFMADGRFAEAVLTYRQALVSDPDNPDLLIGLGMALAAQGRDRSAVQVLNLAASQKPDDVSIKNVLDELIPWPQDGLSLSLVWFAQGIDSEPTGAAMSSGRIFVAYTNGHLLALEQVSGQVLWDVEAPAAFVSPPAADAHQVWVGAEDGSIFVYEADSGQMLGHYPTNGAVYAAPVLTPEIAYCPSNDGTLYALDRASLELVWKTELGEALHASPLVDRQALYVGSNDGRVYAFSASSGERIWAYGILTQGAVESVPASTNGRIFVGSGDGRLYALDAETGGEYWRFSAPDAIYARALVLDDRIIVASSGQVLASLRYADGLPDWSLFLDQPITEAPVYFKERLFIVARGDPRLFAVDHQAGELLGELNTGDWIAHGPLVAGTDLILVGKDGAVFLYR